MKFKQITTWIKQQLRNDLQLFLDIIQQGWAINNNNNKDI